MLSETIYVGFDCPVELNGRIEAEAKANGGSSKAAIIRATLMRSFFPLTLDKNPTTSHDDTLSPEAHEVER